MISISISLIITMFKSSDGIWLPGSTLLYIQDRNIPYSFFLCSNLDQIGNNDVK